MKNILKGFVTLLVVTLLCGCGAPKETTVKCTLSNKDLTNGYEINSTYNVYATDDVVKKVVTKEEVTSDQESILSYFEETLNTTYETYDKEYGGYTYNITKEDNKVTSDVTIDYNKMDLKKFAEDQSAIKSAMNSNNELTLDGIKSMYKAMGATCE